MTRPRATHVMYVLHHADQPGVMAGSLGLAREHVKADAGAIARGVQV
jgi:hypothetical protein